MNHVGIRAVNGRTDRSSEPINFRLLFRRQEIAVLRERAGGAFEKAIGFHLLLTEFARLHIGLSARIAFLEHAHNFFVSEAV